MIQPGTIRMNGYHAGPRPDRIWNMTATAAIRAITHCAPQVLVVANALVLASALAVSGEEMVAGSTPQQGEQTSILSAQAARPPFELVGTLVGTRDALAIFSDRSTGRTVLLRVGDAQHGWRLRSIQAGKATFEKDGEKATYGLVERMSAGQIPPQLIGPAPSRVPPQVGGAPERTGSPPAIPKLPPPAQTSAITPARGDLPAFDSKPAPPDPVTEWLRRTRP
jgi:hypothetical protein